MYNRRTLLALLITHATAVGRPPQEALVTIVTRLRPSYNVLSMLVVFSTSPITLLTAYNIEKKILIATLLFLSDRAYNKKRLLFQPLFWFLRQAVCAGAFLSWPLC